MESRYQMYKSQGYQQYMIIGAASGFGSVPTSTYCKTVRAQYGLTFPVLYDPTGAFKAAYGFFAPNELNVVLDQGGEIVFKGHYSSQSSVQAAIEGAL